MATQRQVMAMRYWTIGLALLWAGTAGARDYCPDRPGLDTPPCTIEPGRLSAELSLADWTRDSAPDMLGDTVLIGDLALRYGIAAHGELRLGWTGYGHVRTRDRAGGAITSAEGGGDITIGLKRNLVDPDGKAFSIALLPSLTLPTGGRAIGAGDWGAGLLLPLSTPLSEVVSLDLTPEVDAAVDATSAGRHLAYGAAGGLAIAPLKGLNIAIEAAVLRDEDPAGAHTRSTAGLAAGLMLGERLQVDMGSEFGLNPATPDLHLYVGIARKF